MKKSFTAKLWKVMTVCAVQAIAAITLCGVALSHPNHAQLLDREISIRMNSVPFEKALKQLEKVARVQFAYSIDQLEDEPDVSLTIEKESLARVLEKLLSTRKIRYNVHEKEAVITLQKATPLYKHEPSPPENNRDRHRSVHEALQVTGTVTDAATKQPMAGVNILVKGTNRGTTSDSNGKFSIEAYAGDVLVFSFIGYASFEWKLSGETELAIELHEDIASLKEVVVNAGYYDVKAKEGTGNIVKVEAEDIQKHPVSNSLSALQGRVPGLEIIQSSGLPGSSFTVRIRGTNSIANGNDPLYIIDGVPYTSTSLAMRETSDVLYLNGTSPLNSISPSDIESIEVLKDADATAIYGSRGANGVILITTRRGKPGRTKVDFKLNSGIGKVARKMELLSSQRYLEMRREALQSSGSTPTVANAPDLVLWDTTRFTDWQDVLLGGTAGYSDASVSISGGSNLTQFAVGAAYHREATVFPGDNSDSRLSTKVNINNKSSNERFETRVSAIYSVNATNMLKRDLTRIALTLAPVAPPLYNDQGKLNWGSNGWFGTGINTHPLSYTQSIFDSRTTTLIGNFTVSYLLLPNLEIRGNAGATNVAMDAITTSPISSYDPAYAKILSNSSAFAESTFRNWITEPQINWRTKLWGGRLDALAGISFLDQRSESQAQIGRGYSSESLMKNLNAADVILKGTSTSSQYLYHALFARLNYTFGDKYIFNLTGRRDGSSRFGPGRRFSNFGAVGGAWIFSHEKFLSQSSGLSFGKLRTSYGVTGSDQIGDYQFLDTYSTSGSGSYMGTNGLSPQRLFNADFAWETVRKFELAIELGFLKDRITFAASHYRNRSSNQLVGMPLPPTTGFSSIQSNFPAIVQNSGLELQLKAIPFETGDSGWTVDLNLSVPRNKLVSFPDLAKSAYASSLEVGEPLSISKQYHYAGVDASTGVYEFEDINGDDSFSSADRTAIGFNGRYYYVGIASTIYHKRFQLDVLVEGVKQDGRSHILSFSVAPGRQYNQPQAVMSRWRKEGDIADVQQFNTLGAFQTAYSRLLGSDRVIVDASYIRLKNISLSWSPPNGLLSKAHLEHMRLFLQGQNVFTITNYEGLDPESQSAVLPPLRVLAAGIQLTL